MGAWGTGLYSNDTASDVRDDFMELLRAGNSKETATEKLMQQNKDLLQDEEEAALFWYALADTQWNRGMLLPEVMQNALSCLEHKEIELQRWLDSGGKYANRWLDTLNKLEAKLRQPQPPEKKLQKRRLFHCPWALGDVFAYRLAGERSKEAGFYGKYLVFRKISEEYWYPGHIIPVVKLYAWLGDQPPALEEISSFRILPVYHYTRPIRKPSDAPFYWGLISQRAKEIPADQLILLGNLPGPDCLPYDGEKNMWCSTASGVGWEGSVWNRWVEKQFIDQYLCFSEPEDYAEVAEKQLQSEAEWLAARAAKRAETQQMADCQDNQ